MKIIMENKALLHLTKVCGLSKEDWTNQLLIEARCSGYLLDLKGNQKSVDYFYNSDYSAEDAWQEIFNESQPM